MFIKRKDWFAGLQHLTLTLNKVDEMKTERALLLAEIDQLRELVRSLEAERDQWQRQAISNGH